MTTRNRRRPPSGTARRSFALPARLLEEVREATPPGGPGNLNAIVRAALEEYVARRQEEAFAEDMARMAADPQIQALNRAIDREFRCTERDGLHGGGP